MPDDLRQIASLFRAAAGQLRRLSTRPIRTKPDTIVAIEAYLYQDQTRSAPAFPPDRCQETAHLLEELADHIEALAGSSRRGG